MRHRSIVLAGAVVCVLAVATGCGKSGGGSSNVFLGHGGAIGTHPSVQTAQFLLDGGSATGTGNGTGGNGGSIAFTGTTGVAFGGATANLPNPPPDKTSAPADVIVPAGSTIKFSALRAGVIAARASVDNTNQADIIRVRGDVVIAGTLNVDVDQALLDSTDGNVYVSGTVMGATPTAQPFGNTANATYAFVAEQGFVRVGGVLQSTGMVVSGSATDGGGVFLGGRSVFLAGNAAINTSGVNAPPSGGNGSNAGLVVLGNPMRAVSQLSPPNGPYPTYGLLSADGGALLIDDGVLLQMRGGNAAGALGMGGNGGLLRVVFNQNFAAAVPDDRITAGMSGQMLADGGAGVGFGGGLFAGAGGSGGAIVFYLSGSLDFSMSMSARGGSAQDDVAGTGGSISYFTPPYDARVTVGGAMPVVHLNGGSSGGGAGGATRPIPGAAGSGGQLTLLGDTGGISFVSQFTANGGDTGTTVTTSANAGAGGVLFLSNNAGDIALSGTVTANGGQVIGGASLSAAAGQGGAVGAFSSDGGITNRAQITLAGGSVLGTAQAGAGGLVALIVDDQLLPTVSRVAGAGGAPNTISLTAAQGLADDDSGSVLNTAPITALGGNVVTTTAQPQGGAGGTGGTVILDADPNGNNLPAGVTGRNTATIDASGGNAAGTVGGTGGAGGMIVEIAPSGTGSPGPGPSFVNDPGVILRANAGTTVGFTPTTATTPLVR